jgi:hypothetical protein
MAFSRSVRNRLDRSVIVAVIGMRMMQPPIHQIIEMIAVGNGRVSAARAVHVGGSLALRQPGVAAVRMDGIDGDDMFVAMIAVGIMEMAVVKIIDMPLVAYGGVPTALAVGVFGMTMGMMLGHG